MTSPTDERFGDLRWCGAATMVFSIVRTALSPSMSGIVHAFALAGAENIAAKDLAPFAQAGIGLLPGIIADLARQIDDGHHPGDRSAIVSAAAGMEHIMHAAQARGIDVDVLSAARAIAQRAIDTGHGTDGFSRLAEMLGKPTPA